MDSNDITIVKTLHVFDIFIDFCNTFTLQLFQGLLYIQVVNKYWNSFTFNEITFAQM